MLSTASRGRPPPVALLFAFLLIALVLAACPKVIREPTPDPPRATCTQGATLCYQGHPWVCDPSGEYSHADRRCDRLETPAVCCLARSPYDAGVRHACVPRAACLAEDGGAP